MISGVCAAETVTLIRSLHFCQTLRCFYAVGQFQLYVIWPCALVCLGLTRLTEDSCPSSRWNAMCRPCCEYQLIQCQCPSKGLKVGYTVPCCRNALNQCDPCIIPPGTTSVTATHLTSHTQHIPERQLVFCIFFQPFSFLFLFEAAVCLKTVKPVTTEPGRPMMTSLSMENIAQSVVKAGAAGTVKVSCTGE